MNGMITDDLKKADTESIKRYRIEKPVAEVSTDKIRFLEDNGSKKISVVGFRGQRKYYTVVAKA
jgi:hypothetical protein